MSVGEPEVAWEWEDGWRLVRVEHDTYEQVFASPYSSPPTCPLEALLLRYDTKRLRPMNISSVHGEALIRFLLLDRGGDPVSMVFAVHYDGENGVFFFIGSYAQDQFSLVVRHFVSMVGQLVERTPAANFLYYFAQDLVCAPETSIPDDVVLPKYDATPIDVVQWFSRVHVPGLCPNPEAELDLLLGNLPPLLDPRERPCS